jgi:hypothetical protein
VTRDYEEQCVCLSLLNPRAELLPPRATLSASCLLFADSATFGARVLCACFQITPTLDPFTIFFYLLQKERNLLETSIKYGCL